MSAHLKSLIPKLANKTILVIGDVILDEYIMGQATRMSREAPIPVLEFESRRAIAGGSANPAANIVSLGSHAIQVGVVGDDDSGKQLIQVLNSQGINTQGLVICDDRPTTVKTRIMAHMGLRFPQQVARIDTLSRQPISANIESQILNFVTDQIGSVQGVLLSHYHGGLLTESLVQAVRALCKQQGVLLTADVQGKFDKFSGVDVMKCNADDASTYLDMELKSDTDFADSARHLYKQLGIKRCVVITRGGDGATLATADELSHCPAPNVSDVFDTVGAGDTSIALITLALSVSIAPYDAVILANYASGIVVRHVGNYAPSPIEFAQALQS